MSENKKDPVLVVLQLSGGNDYFNTVIPYTDPLYRDNRPAVGVAEEQDHPHRRQSGVPPKPGPDEGALRPG